MPFHVSLIFNRLGQLRKVPELNDSSKGMELQHVCRELGIRATGKKAELIARIRLQSRALPRQGGAAQTSQTNRNLLRNLKTSPDQARTAAFDNSSRAYGIHFPCRQDEFIKQKKSRNPALALILSAMKSMKLIKWHQMK